MANQQNQNKTASGTNKKHVKQQNQQAAQGQGQFGTEFGTDQTDPQQVRKQNQQSESKKK